MADITLSTAIRTARATAVLTALDAGAGPAVALLYTGTPPATCGPITDQTLLGTLTCSDPAGTVLDGVLTFAAITPDAAADTSGTAGFLRLADSDGAVAVDLVCGIAGSGKPVILNQLGIVQDGPISVTSASFVEGGA